MSYKHEFIQVLSAEIKKHPNDLMTIRECLVNFKNNGMDKESMLESLEQLRSGSSSEESPKNLPIPY